MKREIALNKRMALLIIISILVASIGWILACAPKYFTAPDSPDKFPFTGFSIPERKPAASVKLTVAVVNPKYIERLAPEYNTFAKSFSNALGASLDEIVVAKGMTVKGPYEDLEVIPYPDKQATNLTLSPQVSINFSRPKQVSSEDVVFIKTAGKQVMGDIVRYEMNVEGWISLEMREPLSGEKMWIKKLDLGSFQTSFEVGFTRKGGNRTNEIIFDSRQDAVASSLSKMYPKILQTTWDYLNTDEMFVLDKKGGEIRKLKRY